MAGRVTAPLRYSINIGINMLKGMLSTITIAALLLGQPGLASDYYCDDQSAVDEWNTLITDKYPGNNNWQELHAIWLGLCLKVKQGSIGKNHAIDVFERARERAIRIEKNKTVTNTGSVG